MTDAAHEVVRVALPTRYGVFEGRAFRVSSGLTYLTLIQGEVDGGTGVLTRLHSECLTGDVFASLRCDCGIQLHQALRTIAARRRGILLYVTGHEGRGVGLVDKLRAYVEQDRGADTLDANVRLGLPVDGRRYDDAGTVLQAIGVSSVRLLTNNPAKVSGLEAAGVAVEAVEPLQTAAHVRTRNYLQTKGERLGHLDPAGRDLEPAAAVPPDVTQLLGQVRPRADRPYVVLKYAQTLDGRIATASGDSKWISGTEERRVSHALRAACDAVLVGVGTVLTDDPQLSVRLVPGASPRRVVLDSTLRTPMSARVLDGDGVLAILTTGRSSEVDRERFAARDVGVHVLPAGNGGVDLGAALRLLRRLGVNCLLVEGGARVITSLLRAGLVDRLIVGTAPKIIGSGTEAVGNLGVADIASGISLTNRRVSVTSDDILTAWDVECAR
jgi:GTP cyclohydrolase II